MGLQGDRQMSGVGQGEEGIPEAEAPHSACLPPCTRPSERASEGGTHTQTLWQLAWASSPTDLQREPLLPRLLSSPPPHLLELATLISG